MQSQLNQLQTVEPTHQKEILQLEVEIKEAEAKYQENLNKANKETDPNKKAKFIASAQEAETKFNQAKHKLSHNPLSKLAQYSYLLDIGRLIGGNIDPEPVNIPNPNSNNSNEKSSPNKNPRNEQTPQTS